MTRLMREFSERHHKISIENNTSCLLQQTKKKTSKALVGVIIVGLILIRNVQLHL